MGNNNTSKLNKLKQIKENENKEQNSKKKFGILLLGTSESGKKIKNKK
jgi:hypothetical protein